MSTGRKHTLKATIFNTISSFNIFSSNTFFSAKGSNRFLRLLSVLILNVLLFSKIYAQDGATNFKTICAACHSIGKGSLVGPDLAGVTDRRSEAWLLKFIKSSQTVIKSGDKTADSLFKAYNQVMMPDQPSLDDAKIKDILAYIKTTSVALAPSTTASSIVTETPRASAQEWQWSDFFTFPNILLLGLVLLMLIIILFQLRTIKRLAEKLGDFYSSDRSFFKKQK